MAVEDPAEVAAFHYVPKILGVELEEFDKDGRQSAVDALLHYEDGHVAALEVTSGAAPGKRQLYVLLDATSTLPNPGNWTWSASIGDPIDLPQLLERVERLILKSEARGVTRPNHDYEAARTGDEDFAWIIRSSVSMWGSPELPKIREHDGAERPLFLTPSPQGGAVDEALEGFEDAVSALLAQSHVQKRIEKLSRAGHNEQHLFLLLDFTALPFSVAYVLANRDAKPRDPPRLPGSVTHLWLLMVYSPWIYLGTTQGWLRYDRDEWDAVD